MHISIIQAILLGSLYYLTNKDILNIVWMYNKPYIKNLNLF